MGKASRDKGKRGERWFADQLRQALPECRDLIKRGWQSRGAAAVAEPDVHCPGVWLEVKHGAAPRAHAALIQAEADAVGTGLMPVAAIKPDRTRPYVLMRWDDWLELYTEAHRARQQ